MNSERQDLILTIIKEKKALRINNLSKLVNYSTSTVRRDIKMLEKLELVKTENGVVSFVKENLRDSPLDLKVRTNKERKTYIGSIAIDFIEEFNTIFLDSSSTSLIFSEFLSAYKNLRIFTTNLQTAKNLELLTNNQIYIVGGMIKNGVSNGLEAVDQLKKIHFDTAFISARGLSQESGFTENDEADAHIKRLLHSRTKTMVGLIDSSKFDKKFTFKSIDEKQLDYLVTDLNPDKRILEFLEENNIDVLY